MIMIMNHLTLPGVVGALHCCTLHQLSPPPLTGHGQGLGIPACLASSLAATFCLQVWCMQGVSVAGIRPYKT